MKETLEHSFLITNTNKEGYEDHINIKRTNICINWMEIAPLSQLNYEVVIVSFTTLTQTCRIQAQEVTT